MDSTNPKVVVIAGPNGAGKSTLAPILLRDTLHLLEYVNADTIALGLSAFHPEVAAFEAGRIMLKRLHYLADQRMSFAFETTLATRSYALWLKELCQNGYEVHLLFVWVQTPELAVERVKARVRAGGHDVPESVIYRRYQKGIRNFFRLYQVLAKSWGVYDNSSELPLLLASGVHPLSTTVHQSELWQHFYEVGHEH